MKTVLLVDGAFIRKKFRSTLKRDITAPDLPHIAEWVFKELGSAPEQYRVYFYDCPPCSEKTSFPISHSALDFASKCLTLLAKLCRRTAGAWLS
jgi:hypothetical protein